MSPALFIVALILVFAQLLLPRRLAFLPLLIAACHTGTVTVVGEFNVIRLVIMAGILRAVLNQHLSWTPRNPLDLLMAIWVALALISSVAHESGRSNPFVYRAGLVFNVFGTYLYGRAYLQAPGMIVNFSKGLVAVLSFLAIFLAIENQTLRNQYGPLGSPKEESTVRNGRVRAQGPFGTPILAGTVGATALPIVIALRQHSLAWMRVGVVACVLIALSSGSSGPLSTLFIAGAALLLWRWRQRLRLLACGAVAGLFFIALWMDRPIWYLMVRVDIVGGSTGWHRAKLIDVAVQHLGEWWIAGTGYTRHWMPYGLRAVPEHCDLTNYYIHLGVIGGLTLVAALVAVLIKSFQLLGRRLVKLRREESPEEFTVWCLIAALIAHSITFLSVSYFDNMFVLFWIVVGAVPGFIGWRLVLNTADYRVLRENPHLAWYPT